ncbi:hypothetical protein [uncultured Paracoccus sp.]|uniref:hypothetical protein n=1 Tax=uncultured Paracoccus sp. TaxID=189685 RepID=UPI00262A03AC|nr:hypothetical protein [uncultured Paracoccus sp.]
MIWTTGDYALIVSLCSAGIALLSLGWNVWSKFIYPRPKLKVRCRLYVSYPELGVSRSMDDGQLPSELSAEKMEYPAGGIEVSNVGPIAARLTNVRADHARGKKDSPQSRFSVYRSYPPDPDSSGSDRWYTFGALGEVIVEPGQTRTLFFPVTPSMFGRLRLDNVGVEDGYGRVYYVPATDMRRLQRLVSDHVIDPE